MITKQIRFEILCTATVQLSLLRSSVSLIELHFSYSTFKVLGITCLLLYSSLPWSSRSFTMVTSSFESVPLVCSSCRPLSSCTTRNIYLQTVTAELTGILYLLETWLSTTIFVVTIITNERHNVCLLLVFWCRNLDNSRVAT